MRQRMLSFVPFLLIAALLFAVGCATGEKRVKVVEQVDKVEEAPPQPGAPTLSDQVREVLKTRIQTLGVPPRFTVGEKPIYTTGALVYFYERRNYSPAWSNDGGLLPQADAFISVLNKAGAEGLRPGQYHTAEIGAALREIRQNKLAETPLEPDTLAGLDLLLTDAFMLYGSHLLYGRVNPQSVDETWLITQRETDLPQALQFALDFNKIEETLKNLTPHHPTYGRLVQALNLYRGIAVKGGWTAVPGGPKMEKGSRGERVAALRNRLLVTGDLVAGGSAENYDLFDDALDAAVRNFQGRHGLSADGVVGASTLAALNVPVEERVRQIELNLERWRWLPQNLGGRYILVNIANFELYAVENNQTVMDMRVVVGKPYWYTPVFSADMTYLVINPVWNIPESIFAEEVLAKIQNDPEYLSRQNINIYKGWSASAEQVDPATIDWTKVNEKNFSYNLRQQAGPRNPLGRIKFMFPNQFNVYLHDTPLQSLFKRARRNFSHGCIRVERPIELAEYVLSQNSGWTGAKIRKAVNKGATQTVNLPESIPVYLLYFTVWAAEDGTVEFRDDIYGRDRALDEALRSTLVSF